MLQGGVQDAGEVQEYGIGRGAVTHADLFHLQISGVLGEVLQYVSHGSIAPNGVQLPRAFELLAVFVHVSVPEKLVIVARHVEVQPAGNRCPRASAEVRQGPSQELKEGRTHPVAQGAQQSQHPFQKLRTTHFFHT